MIKTSKFIKSGNLNLDKALGIGGFQKGRIIDIYDSELSGKLHLFYKQIPIAKKVFIIATILMLRTL